MEFYFIDKTKVEVTEYSYKDFDNIIRESGYSREKNGDLHLYFDWKNIMKWEFRYELFSDVELAELFKNSVVYKKNIDFLVRLGNGDPLVKIKSLALAGMLEDLCYEVSSMGWEAISVCGKYIMEFTDDMENLAKSNFQILF